MLRFALSAVALTAALTSGALAATVSPLPASLVSASTLNSEIDVAFNDLCGPGAAANNACETAVAEFQLGRSTNFRNEVDARGAEFGTPKTDLSPGFQDGIAEAFTVRYDAQTSDLTVSIQRDTGVITDSFNIANDRFADTSTIAIRVRSARMGTTTLSDMFVNGVDVGTLSTGGNGDERDYLFITGVDGSADLLMEGMLAFGFTGNDRAAGDAAFAVQIKFTDLELAPIPLPAGGFLLLGGLAALGAMRRRRRI